ncbi:sigma 54-interacting transcriptional regulator [Virgibacillus sp. W0181]|uniref:sigma 54-interacting transcriptional regulator n=1 Tax=Virgibacillus sp. W0181 TaxID=3391581 RepID=UPI003F4580C0
MKHIIFIGAGNKSTALMEFLIKSKRVKIKAVIDSELHAPGIAFALNKNIPVDSDWKKWITKDIDVIIESTGNESTIKALMANKSKHTHVIPAVLTDSFYDLHIKKKSVEEQLELQKINRDLILNNIRDGMIVTNEQGIITFINKRAEEITGFIESGAIGKDITEVIYNSRLPQVLKSRRKEVNQMLQLKNDKKVIATRVPIINGNDHLLGAFAIFKDITEVVNLAEENTDLKEIKMMLEAIIYSSDEAISVVDENGKGIMINPAYTRITGLLEKDVIGKPATADISEGESMHLKVLQTRRPVRGVKLKVGPKKKEVLVNVAPVIVNGKIKGSVGVIHDVSEIQSLTKELERARQIIRNLEARYTLDDIIGTSPEINLAIEQAKVGAKTPAIVLLRGESGTGKELFAHAIHNESNRKHHKFIRVNCAAIAESILESELFGYEEGAFTGAKTGGKKGLFEEANNGSIFLDEIGELSLSMQSKLLRVLQENEILRVGGTVPITLDVRIIAATNVNLEKAIMNGTFREDLYYRINRLPVTIPSLRERISDLAQLTEHIIEKINRDYGRNIQSISHAALLHLQNYHWPGNIRELENVIGRAMIYMDMNEEIIEEHHLPKLNDNVKTDQSKRIPDAESVADLSLQEAIDFYEKEFIYEVYKKNNFNKTQTAKQLNVSIRNLYYKFNKHNIEKNSTQ